jgi:hypothetical protein
MSGLWTVCEHDNATKLVYVCAVLLPHQRGKSRRETICKDVRKVAGAGGSLGEVAMDVRDDISSRR